MNLSTWSEQALHAANSTATLIGIAAAVVALIAIAVIYFTGAALGTRVQTKITSSAAVAPQRAAASSRATATPRNGQDSPKVAVRDDGRVSELQKQLATVRQEKEGTTARLAQLDAELAMARLATDAKEARLSQLQHELSDLRSASETKTARMGGLEKQLAEAQKTGTAKANQLSELDRQLAEARNADAAKEARLTELETDLTRARQSAEQAQAQTKQVEQQQGPRKLSAEQRARFAAAVKGMAAGKVIVSAFFENQETHEFGAELIALFKKAGFSVVDAAPVNFFTTSRPLSGIRVGCLDLNNPPPHLATIRKALTAMGFEAPDSTVVNAEEADVVEIQITPRQ